MKKELLDASFVRREMAWWNVPGVQIGVVRADSNGNPETLYSSGFGFRDVEHDLPMTSDSLGGIASCSKAFTAAIVASLVEEGKLDWDRPIREYLPFFALKDPFAAAECTLRDMLYHRTGIAGHDALWPNPDWSRRDYFEHAAHMTPNKPFRSVAQYNNTIYNLIGMIAEEVTGESYADLLRTRILEPLEMTRSCLTLQHQRADTDWARGYFSEDIGPASPLRPMDGWEMSPLGDPAAGIYSCASDMTHWLTLHLSRGVYKGKRIFSTAVMDEMHEPALRMSPFPWRFEEIPGYGFYGMAWKTAVYRGLTMTYHMGEIEGYCSSTVFFPQKGLGIFVLCNRHTMMSPFLMELVYTAADAALGYESPDWANRLHPYARDFSGPCEAWSLDLMPHPTSSPAVFDADDYADCAGTYVSDVYGTMTLQHGADGKSVGVSYMPLGRDPSPVSLYLRFKDWLLPLEPAPECGRDVFRIRNFK